MSTTPPKPQPFTIAVPDELLQWIQQRLETARFPIPLDPGKDHKPFTYGIPVPTVSSLVDYWKTSYNWREVETELNTRFNHFTAPIHDAETDETINLHFIHHRSPRADALPLMFVHGWPGSFLEAAELIKPLTDPDDPATQAFHLVAPSLPGFAFSSPARKSGFGIRAHARVLRKLMVDVLGYKKFLLQGGDMGSVVSRAIALENADGCVEGVHLNFLVASPPQVLKTPLAMLRLATGWYTKNEGDRMGRQLWWMTKEAGYAQIMGNKPQTLAYGLVDSPVAQLAWMRDKLEFAGETIKEPRTLITWVMLFVIAGNSQNSAIYRELHVTDKEAVLENCIGPEVSVGFSAFKHEIGYMAKWWAEGTVATRFEFWREHDTGGHFASTEASELLIADVRDWVKGMPEEKKKRLVQAKL